MVWVIINPSTITINYIDLVYCMANILEPLIKHTYMPIDDIIQN